MKTKEIAQEYVSLEGLTDTNKQALLNLIDLKIENDMKDVILEIRGLNTEIRNQEVKMGGRLDGQAIKIDSRFAQLDTKFDTQQKLIWGLLITMVIAIFASVIGTILR